MLPSPLEKVIESKVSKYAKDKGWRVYKFVSPGNIGVPDRIFISPLGIVVFIEFKRLNGKLSPLQKRQLEILENQNCKVHVCKSIEQGKEVVDSYA